MAVLILHKEWDIEFVALLTLQPEIGDIGETGKKHSIN